MLNFALWIMLTCFYDFSQNIYNVIDLGHYLFNTIKTRGEKYKLDVMALSRHMPPPFDCDIIYGRKAQCLQQKLNEFCRAIIFQYIQRSQ
ncbi:MAG: hypothetical protein U9Q89_03075, partial [Thermodesulfobacteriota bacterium]|nr:hypothetical protein [Thermodesulfobacteriota bacterium]